MLLRARQEDDVTSGLSFTQALGDLDMTGAVSVERRRPEAEWSGLVREWERGTWRWQAEATLLRILAVKGSKEME